MAIRWQSLVKPIVFLLALSPFIYLVQALLSGALGPNPIDALTDVTGTLAIRMLLISLALTPLRWLLKATWPGCVSQIRRFGLMELWLGTASIMPTTARSF